MNKNIVRLENSFAEKAQYSLRARSQHLFLYLISLVNTEKQEFEDIVLSVQDIESVLKQAKHSERKASIQTVKWGNFAEEVKPYLEELKSCTFTIPSKIDYQGGKLPIFTDLFTRIEPCKINNKAHYRFIFSEDMKSFLLELTRYVQFKWISVVGIKNVHGIRLYMALKSSLNKQKKYRAIIIVKYSIQELRDLFGLTPKTNQDKVPYPKTNDFKRYVIERAVSEITLKSDLYVIPKYIKKGRALSHVEFQVSESKYNPNQLSLALNDKSSFEYKYLSKLSRLNYGDVDLEEVKKILPAKYHQLKEEIYQKVDETVLDLKRFKEDLFGEEQITIMKKDHLRSEFIKYARVTISD